VGPGFRVREGKFCFDLFFDVFFNGGGGGGEHGKVVEIDELLQQVIA